jgi:hypothetical protein
VIAKDLKGILISFRLFECVFFVPPEFLAVWLARFRWCVVFQVAFDFPFLCSFLMRVNYGKRKG